MDSSKIKIKCTCGGNVTIDGNGIKTDTKVNSKWTGKTFNIRGTNNISGTNNICFNNGVIVNSTINNCNVVFNNSYGGYSYVSNTYSSDTDDKDCTKAIVNESWSDNGFTSVLLSELTLAGSSHILVDIPLSKKFNIILSGSGDIRVVCPITDCNVNIKLSGTGTIHILGPVKNSKFNITLSGTGGIITDTFENCDMYAAVSGTGNIRSRTSTPTNIRKLDLSMTGTGMIYGFIVSNKLKAYVGGISNVNLMCENDCKIDKERSGLGNITITKV